MLDLNKAATGLFGGPYLWFNYITRMIVQETAKLLVDYNLHAMPRDRLACAPAAPPARIGIGSGSPGDRSGGGRRAGSGRAARRHRGGDRGAAPAPPARGRRLFRERRVHGDGLPGRGPSPRRGDPGPVRRPGARAPPPGPPAERPAGLPQLPPAPAARGPEDDQPVHALRDLHGGGRVLLLPFRLVAWAVRGLAVSWRGSSGWSGRSCTPGSRASRGSRPTLTWLRCGRSTGCASRRSCNRSGCGPGSTWSIWGCPCPRSRSASGATRCWRPTSTSSGRPATGSRPSGFAAQAERLAWIARLLDHLGWGFRTLPGELARDFPHLTDRAGEGIRALVTACIVDHDDIATLGLSIEGLRLVIDHAADPANDLRRLPPGLPGPWWVGPSSGTRSARGGGRTAEVIDPALLPRVDQAQAGAS